MKKCYVQLTVMTKVSGHAVEGSVVEAGPVMANVSKSSLKKQISKIKQKLMLQMNKRLRHRFLTGGPWRVSWGSAKMTKNKVLYPFKPLLYGFRGPPVVPSNTIGFRESFYFIFRGPRSKKG